jgi:hypothetical protein
MDNVQKVNKYINTYSSRAFKYCQILGVYLTYKTGYGFDDRIYWSFIQFVTSFHRSLSSDGHTRPLTSNCTELNGQSESLYDWWFTANQFVLDTSPLGPTTK